MFVCTYCAQGRVGYHLQACLPLPNSHHHPNCLCPTSCLILQLQQPPLSPFLSNDALCSHTDLSPDLIRSPFSKTFPSPLLPAN